MVQGMYYSLQIHQKYPGDEFQLKFRLTRIATYDFLTKIGLETISNCDFWGDEKKGLAYLFWFCFKVSRFWSSLISRLISFEVLPAKYKLNVSIALGLRPDSSKSQHQSNFTCLRGSSYELGWPGWLGYRDEFCFGFIWEISARFPRWEKVKDPGYEFWRQI